MLFNAAAMEGCFQKSTFCHEKGSPFHAQSISATIVDEILPVIEEKAVMKYPKKSIEDTEPDSPMSSDSLVPSPDVDLRQKIESVLEEMDQTTVLSSDQALITSAESENIAEKDGFPTLCLIPHEDVSPSLQSEKSSESMEIENHALKSAVNCTLEGMEKFFEEFSNSTGETDDEAEKSDSIIAPKATIVDLLTTLNAESLCDEDSMEIPVALPARLQSAEKKPLKKDTISVKQEKHPLNTQEELEKMEVTPRKTSETPELLPLVNDESSPVLILKETNMDEESGFFSGDSASKMSPDVERVNVSSAKRKAPDSEVRRKLITRSSMRLAENPVVLDSKNRKAQLIAQRKPTPKKRRTSKISKKDVSMIVTVPTPEIPGVLDSKILEAQPTHQTTPTPKRSRTSKVSKKGFSTITTVSAPASARSSLSQEKVSESLPKRKKSNVKGLRESRAGTPFSRKFDRKSQDTQDSSNSTTDSSSLYVSMAMDTLEEPSSTATNDSLKRKLATEEKPVAKRARKNAVGDFYEVGKYPLKRLAREAFVVEAIPKKICHECLDNKFMDLVDDCFLDCIGPCKRTVHIQCVRPGIHIPASDKQPEQDSDVDAFRQALGDQSFTCEECKTGFRECFLCEGKASDLVKCPEEDCGQFYHRKCLLGPNATDKDKLKPCPQHECHTCKRQGRTTKDKTIMNSLTRCGMCPVAFHYNYMCFPIEATICVDNPKFHTCWKHENPDEAKKSGKKNRIDSKICFTCQEGGALMMCSQCPMTVHADCVGLDEVPEGDWLCHDCVKGTKPLLLDIVWYKCGVHRPWPCQILPIAVVPEKVRNMAPAYHHFVMRFLGTNEFAFAQSKDVLPYDICDPNWKRNSSKAKGFRAGIEEAKKLTAELLIIKSGFVDEYFFGIQQPYNKIRTNKVVFPAIYGRSFSKEDVDICNCKKTDPDPCGPTSPCLNRSMENECHPKFCVAEEKCQNQRLRKRQYPKLKVFYTADRGWALKTLQDLKKGDLIIEYCGEIITAEERNARIRKQLASGNVNFYYLDLTNNRVIDAGPSGNDARFANHSCDANSSSQKWIVDGETRIALIAIKNIAKGEEITFDYRWEYESGVTSRECLCGVENCQGKIGGKKEYVAPAASSKKTASQNNSMAKKKRRSSKI